MLASHLVLHLFSDHTTCSIVALEIGELFFLIFLGYSLPEFWGLNGLPGVSVLLRAS